MNCSECPTGTKARDVRTWKCIKNALRGFRELWRERGSSTPAGHKQRLLGALAGDVLEIGPGGGTNLVFYSPAVRWTGVEPNPYMHDYLRQKAERLGREFSLRPGSAERIAAEDGTFDAVVSTLVLCSVRDPSAALAEILRVQRWIRPVWRILGDGCRPERETWASIQHAGFEKVDLQHFRVPFPVIGPHIAGLAMKTGK